MTDENSPTYDPWAVADEIGDMLDGWDPEAVERPRVDDEWLNRRMLALRFKLDEQQRIRAMYDDQIKRLRAELDRLVDRRDGQLAAEQDDVAALAWQLTTYHAAELADAERRGVPDRRLPKSMRLPHGDLRSRQSGSVRIEFSDEHVDEIVAWLRAAGYDDAIRTRSVPDRAALRDLIRRSDDGEIVGIVNADGERLPHVEYVEPSRRYWVELADGRTTDPHEHD